jgi:hypothetical protein
MARRVLYDYYVKAIADKGKPYLIAAANPKRAAKWLAQNTTWEGTIQVWTGWQLANNLDPAEFDSYSLWGGTR